MQLSVGLRRAALTAALTALCAGAAAGTAQAQTVHGTVVHRISRAQSFVVADSGGRLFAVHGRRMPRVGSRVVVSLRRLRNGTFAANAVHVVGRTHSGKLRGTITYRNRRNGSLTLSARGVSMLIHATRGRVHAAEALPPVGTNVTTTTTIDDQGDGIHGTNEPGSIGSAASHGCIRMLVPDVIQLYGMTPLGTPAYVV